MSTGISKSPGSRYWRQLYRAALSEITEHPCQTQRSDGKKSKNARSFASEPTIKTRQSPGRSAKWAKRTDRGAEERKDLVSRGVLVGIQQLRKGALSSALFRRVQVPLALK